MLTFFFNLIFIFFIYFLNLEKTLIKIYIYKANTLESENEKERYERGLQCYLRGKLDMQDPNKSLRDPNIAGKTWCIRCWWEDLTLPLVLSLVSWERWSWREKRRRPWNSLLRRSSSKKKRKSPRKAAHGFFSSGSQ